jgi:phage shock protein PspC (stress-responsive transcriptional regulator)
MVRRRSRARSYGKCPLRDSRIAKINKLYLTKNNSKILGICGSVGETYDIDPTVERLITVFLCLSTGILPLLLTYLIALA